MHPRVDSLPSPTPDYRRFPRMLRREQVDRVPLIELAIHPRVVDVLLDVPPTSPRDAATTVERNIRLHHRLGYDVVKVSAPIPWRVRRETASGSGANAIQWATEHDGPIANMRDFERFSWPSIGDVDFSPLETAAEVLPDGMGLIGFAGGVLEFSMDLLGMERFMIATVREPDLVSAVIERVGQLVFDVFKTYCEMESVRAIWLGDDLGHKNGLLLSPRFLEERIFPWYKRFADLAHDAGRPLLLHSCGDVQAVLPALVDEVGIDAKHSFEDLIQPVEQFYDRWRDRIAVLGGVDVHLLATGKPDEIRKRVLDILEHVAPHGGYACGSGNSIPDYVPPENYLTMIEAVTEFNGLA